MAASTQQTRWSNHNHNITIALPIIVNNISIIIISVIGIDYCGNNQDINEIV
jgi:hypothetical protein